MSMIKAASKKDLDNWQTRADLDCLLQCEAIEKDPKRYKAALALAKERAAGLKDIVAEAAMGEKS